MSTNPRASTSLTNSKDKRKRSEEGKLEQKRSRTGLIDNQMDTIIPLKTISNPRMAKKIDNVDLITAMMEALSDPRVRGLYVGQFKADCEELIKDAKVQILQEGDDELVGTSKITDDHEGRLTSLKKTVEKREQNERSTNIVIRGMKPCECGVTFHYDPILHLIINLTLFLMVWSFIYINNLKTWAECVMACHDLV